VTEGDKAYMVKADIPGVKKEEIFVDVDGAVVTIRAQVKRETPEGKAPNALHMERFYGVLSRSFTLPLEVNLDATTAKYENGVLTLTAAEAVGRTDPQGDDQLSSGPRRAMRRGVPSLRSVGLFGIERLQALPFLEAISRESAAPVEGQCPE
jgi:hypothetical protein